MSVRWRPLLTHSRKRFWKFCITRCSMVGEIAATLSLMFCFKSIVALGFFSYTLLFEISPKEEVLSLGTLIPMNIEVPTKYPLSQDRIVVFEIRLPSKSPMLYRPALHGNWNALSLARRALKDKFPTSTVPLTALFAKFVRYFCRTLYFSVHCMSFSNCRSCLGDSYWSLGHDVIVWYSNTNVSVESIASIFRIIWIQMPNNFVKLYQRFECGL